MYLGNDLQCAIKKVKVGAYLGDEPPCAIKRELLLLQATATEELEVRDFAGDLEAGSELPVFRATALIIITHVVLVVAFQRRCLGVEPAHHHAAPRVASTIHSKLVAACCRRPWLHACTIPMHIGE
uniref:Uncharacterized protein n=1 Tax=Vitis vinifera TaxID=29760 RepID=A5B3S6_VITVI|nr:hypothetical protein VITISV_032812 [Vitis vinifera]